MPPSTACWARSPSLWPPDGWSSRARARLHRSVYRVGEIAMLAQARVTADQGSRWLQLLAIELATERSARVALQNVGAPADRSALLATLHALRDRVALPAVRSTAPLLGALGMLDHVLREEQTVSLVPAAAPSPASTPAGLRPAVQTAIAAALAIITGALVSSHRWYWAAFAAYVMFQGTRMPGRISQFMIGTVIGVIVGALAGTLLSGHDVITMVAIIVAVFLAFQANVAAFGVMIFWITIMLGLIFGLLGYFPPELLVLRLKETAVGAACGALVASLVLVRREHAATHDATTDFLRALCESVDSAAPRSAGPAARAGTGGQNPGDRAAVSRR